MKVFVVLLAALVVMPGVAAAEPTDGVVTGQVLNNTSGGSSTAGANVILVAFGRKEQAPLGQQTATTTSDGRFQFNGLDRDPNVVYLVVCRFGGVNYPTDAPFQLQAEQSHQADVTVFDSTNADDGIQIERLNLLVLGVDQGSLQLMQMGALLNNGDRTFVTANPQDQALARAIKFPLPPGALGVQMQSGFSQQDVIPGVGGIQVITPILPGRHEFAMSFQLPYNGSSADLSVQVPYPTAAFSVYLPNTGLRLDASSLAAGGPATLGGQSYALYSAANLPKAMNVPSRVNGLGSGAGGLGPTQLALISLGVVLFVLGGGVLLFGARSRATVAEAPPARDLEQERLELVVRMAALDERYAAGNVNQVEYDLERTRGKQRLRELLLLQRQESLSP
ncbi:MAG TPA: hypothetical protein VGL99_11390 [Chloroflexota bacterium]